MPNVALYSMDGSEIGTVELSDSVFAAPVNQAVLHEVVKNYLANQRQGTQSTKTRAEVRGGGIKPWRQKGTGRARQGSIRSPQWTKGGIALGPKPRSYRYTINKKVKDIAMKCALSAKVEDNNLIVVDAFNIDAIKTKTIVSMLEKLSTKKKAIIVTDATNQVVVRSARNIPGVSISHVGALNVYELLKYESVVISMDAVKKLEEVYA